MISFHNRNSLFLCYSVLFLVEAMYAIFLIWSLEGAHINKRVEKLNGAPSIESKSKFSNKYDAIQLSFIEITSNNNYQSSIFIKNSYLIVRNILFMNFLDGFDETIKSKTTMNTFLGVLFGTVQYSTKQMKKE